MNAKILIIISLLLSISCMIKRKNFDSQNQREKIYIFNYNLIPIEENKFIGKDSFQISYWANGNLKEKGKYAFNSQGEITILKTGGFKEYFENGNLEAIGEYEIGKYVQCCAGGLCSQFYNYKSGEWSYYYDSGNLKTKVKYEVTKFPIQTSCKGGDTIRFGQVNISSIQHLDKQGIQTNLSKSDLKKLETITIDNEYYSEEMFIEDGRIIYDLIYQEN